MKRCFVFILIYSSYVSAFAQIDTSGVVDFSSSKNANKLIFIELQLSSYSKISSSNSEKYSPLANKETADFLGTNFNCFRSFAGDSLTEFLIKYQIPKTFPTYYIFDANRNFIYSSSGRNKTVDDFRILRDSSLQKIQDSKNLKLYGNRLSENTITKEEIKELIEIRLRLKKYDNGELIEKFALEMDEADTKNPEILLLIMRSGPFFRSVAYQKARTDTALYNRIYKEKYKNYSPNFYQRSSENSMKYAIEKKDHQMAKTVAQFFQYRFNRSAYHREMYNPRVLMNYYKSIKDTSNFLLYLVKTYDDYLIVTPDSSQRYEAKMLEKWKSQRDKEKAGNARTPTSYKDYYARLLYYGANQIIKSKTKDPSYIYKGIDYCQHALLLAPTYYKSKVTLAHLLYLSGFYNEAEKMQRDAIGSFGVSSSLKARYIVDLEKIIHRNME